ncbi:S8 family serine peptidase [Arthrobacter crystallopoietes]|uniref:S8 family serine peptidase n=1 Tax=Crystallibacter crystallopoietes TaxID=37928 RepID=UPI001ABE573C|nr:S8 family serine peptidase [Arthrobacter crystallopoietes]QTG79605.1 S8 family serine peptidase [Arthrobacter crystallopoietes]
MSQLRPRRFPLSVAPFCAAALLGGLLFPTAASAADDPLPATAEEPHAAAEKPGPGNTEPLPVAPDAGLDRDDVPASGRYVVKFKEKAGRSSAGRSRAYGKTARDLGISVKEVRTTATGAQVIETAATLDSTASQDLVAGLEANPDVAYVEPDPLLQPAAAAPNDPLYKLQWNFWEERAGLRLPGAWDAGRGEGAVVAVVDTGITNHSDLNANVLPGYDMISDPTMSRDGNGRDPDARDAGDWYGAYECGSYTGGTGSSWHGTHVAGIVAAVTGNGKGVAGVAPGAKVLPVRALGACGGYMSDIADGIIWAAGGTVPGVPANPNPADVVNMSLGGSGTCSSTSQAAIDYAYNAGTAVVVAAGNENRDALNATPANCEHVITVAASGREGNRAEYSNFGSVVDVTAPGGDMSTATSSGIASTLNDGATTPGAESYYYSQGTSMAAPHVAGVAALMIAGSGGTMTPDAVEQRLKDSARPMPGTCTQGCGAGLVDAAAAVGSAPSSTPEPPVVEVVPKEAVFTDKDGTAADTYTVPSVEGVSYRANGEPVAAGTHPGSGTVVVTATAQPGYTLKEGSTTEWSHSFSASAIKVDAAAPALAGSTVTPESLNLADGTNTVTVKAQVTDATGAVPPSVQLEHPVTAETVGFGEMKFVSGDVKNGTWERVMTLPESAPTGTWNVTLFPLRDTLGNSSGDFRNLGSVEVAADATPEASPSITSQGDIVAFDSHGQLWNYGHSGTGSTRVMIGASGWTTMDEIHTVDWNADGYIDIIAQSKSGRLYYYQAKRDGGFTRHTIGSSGWASYDLTVTKWRTGDKYPVVIAKNSSTGKLYVYPNDSGTWLSPRYVLGSSGWSDYTLTAMDWDRDGHKDVVAKTPAGQLKLYRGNGSGTFISETRRIVGSSGWNKMSNIVTSNGYAGEGTSGLIARGSDGKLWYYQANKSSWAERELIGTGWSSYTVAGQ